MTFEFNARPERSSLELLKADLPDELIAVSASLDGMLNSTAPAGLITQSRSGAYSFKFLGVYSKCFFSFKLKSEIEAWLLKYLSLSEMPKTPPRTLTLLDVLNQSFGTYMTEYMKHCVQVIMPDDDSLMSFNTNIRLAIASGTKISDGVFATSMDAWLSAQSTMPTTKADATKTICGLHNHLSQTTTRNWNGCAEFYPQSDYYPLFQGKANGHMLYSDEFEPYTVVFHGNQNALKQTMEKNHDLYAHVEMMWPPHARRMSEWTLTAYQIREYCHIRQKFVDGEMSRMRYCGYVRNMRDNNPLWFTSFPPFKTTLVENNIMIKAPTLTDPLSDWREYFTLMETTFPLFSTGRGISSFYDHSFAQLVNLPIIDIEDRLQGNVMVDQLSSQTVDSINITSTIPVFDNTLPDVLDVNTPLVPINSGSPVDVVNFRFDDLHCFHINLYGPTHVEGEDNLNSRFPEASRQPEDLVRMAERHTRFEEFIQTVSTSSRLEYSSAAIFREFASRTAWQHISPWARVWRWWILTGELLLDSTTMTNTTSGVQITQGLPQDEDMVNLFLITAPTSLDWSTAAILCVFQGVLKISYVTWYLTTFDKEVHDFLAIPMVVRDFTLLNQAFNGESKMYCGICLLKDGPKVAKMLRNVQPNWTVDAVQSQANFGTASSERYQLYMCNDTPSLPKVLTQAAIDEYVNTMSILLLKGSQISIVRYDYPYLGLLHAIVTAVRESSDNIRNFSIVSSGITDAKVSETCYIVSQSGLIETESCQLNIGGLAVSGATLLSDFEVQAQIRTSFLDTWRNDWPMNTFTSNTKTFSDFLNDINNRANIDKYERIQFAISAEEYDPAMIDRLSSLLNGTVSTLGGKWAIISGWCGPDQRTLWHRLQERVAADPFGTLNALNHGLTKHYDLSKISRLSPSLTERGSGTPWFAINESIYSFLKTFYVGSDMTDVGGRRFSAIRAVALNHQYTLMDPSLTDQEIEMAELAYDIEVNDNAFSVDTADELIGPAASVFAVGTHFTNDTVITMEGLQECYDTFTEFLGEPGRVLTTYDLGTCETNSFEDGGPMTLQFQDFYNGDQLLGTGTFVSLSSRYAPCLSSEVVAQTPKEVLINDGVGFINWPHYLFLSHWFFGKAPPNVHSLPKFMNTFSLNVTPRAP